MLDILGTLLPDQEKAGSRGDGSPRDLHAPPPEGGAAGRKSGLTTGGLGHRLGRRRTATNRGRNFESEPGSGHPMLGTRGESAGPSVRVVGRKWCRPGRDRGQPRRSDTTREDYECRTAKTFLRRELE